VLAVYYPFEEKVGNIPDPCKVPLFNLKSREIKIIDFQERILSGMMEKIWFVKLGGKNEK